ncbi:MULTISPECIES: dihydrolipoamide acetyltransferase family protein [unclassified Sphaerochaeta]|jgi:pyruvate dehydrogenase E2 component (dihydrolipoamide acetyltransferase)|uniref:dihydrolipoamide acetyltransferase family protein n=1 Tax=unclassified Sphaerochaeta TaxID=2637943 RepID=UPI0025D62BE2|nr:dihydrolipoamide acetyltransferase family protein [Sphaerochaeta sp. UBA5856]
MAQQVVMPKQGNSVESCIIVEWKVKLGDKVAVGDVLCSAETDKSTIDVESTAEGVVLARLFEEGADVPVMVPIAVIGEAGEKVETVAAEEPKQQEAKASEVSASVVEQAPVVAASQAIGASPRARQLSASLGIPLSAVQPTGPKGRIIERDVLSAKGQPLSPVARKQALEQGIEAPASGSGIGGRVLASDLAAKPVEPAVTAPVSEEVTEIAVKGVRKVTARRMMESMHSTCQLSLHAFADARALKRLRAGFKASKPELGLQGITINDLVLFTVSRTLVQFPAFNAHFLGDKILRFAHVHLGVATDTAKGLLVPVLRNSELLSLKQLSEGTKALIGKCKAGTAQPDELTGSTFTVSNVGSFGIEAFTPVLNVPEVAILGVGTIVLKPIEDEDGDVAFVEHIGLSLTMDHQAVDGADAARFLKALMDNIASIDLLLAL